MNVYVNVFEYLYFLWYFFLGYVIYCKFSNIFKYGNDIFIDYNKEKQNMYVNVDLIIYLNIVMIFFIDYNKEKQNIYVNIDYSIGNFFLMLKEILS